MIRKLKVLAAMSGGVDSSAAAALLKEEGYEVLGITIQMLPDDSSVKENGPECRFLSAVEDARSVAELLDIPHYVVNFTEDFENTVIRNFISEYLRGRTPNPCVLCNKEIKFRILLEKALSLGADFIATGHYAKIEYDEKRDRYLLRKAEDPAKDQTYMLYNLTQDQLKKTMFPLGLYKKEKVRELANKWNLPTAKKKESQEICFVPDDNYRNFIHQRVGDEVKPGPFLDTEGNVIGEHQGIPYYTIGQRRGLGLALGYPAYVVDIDKEKNAVIVGTEEETYDKEVIVENNNFIPFDNLEENIKADVKIRYNSRESPAVISTLDKDGKKVKIVFEEEQKAVTPGQAAVYYQDDIVIGGGKITK